MRAYAQCFAMFCLLATLPASGSFAGDAGAELERLNRLRSLGQAYIEEEDYGPAAEVYSQAVSMVPRSVSDIFNLGMTFYQDDRNAEAIETLKRALEIDPSHPFSLYNLGLAYKKSGDTDNALTNFRRVAEAAPEDAASLYNTGLAYSKLGNLDEAKRWFERVTAIDPRHSSAHYNLLQIAARQGDIERRRELAAKFQEIKREEGQLPPGAVDEGRFTGPIRFAVPPEQRPRFASDLAVKWIRGGEWNDRIAEAANGRVARIPDAYQDYETQTTRAVAAWDAGAAVWEFGADGGVSSTPIADRGGWTGGLFGDYDNDLAMDVVLFGPDAIALFRAGDNGFENATQSAGLGAAGAVDALWLDLDHEGDLDLLLAHPDGDSVWINDGSGSFSKAESIEGLILDGGLAWAASDFDLDNDIDLVRVTAAGEIELFSNLREIRFASMVRQPWTESPKPGIRVTCSDLDQDGALEIVLLHARGSPSAVLAVNPDWTLSPWGGNDENLETGLKGVFDMNNDGYEDWLWQNGACTLNQYPAPAGTDTGDIDVDAAIESAKALDLDFDGDLDLVLNHPDSSPSVWLNEGGNLNRRIALTALGSDNTSYGYGAKVEAKDGLFYAKKEIWSPNVHIGVGARDQLDVLRLTWPNGIFQNAIQPNTGQILSVTEKPGYAGSCPFLYTWNGGEFEFVADFLSTGPLGLYVGGGYFPPRPEEYVRIRGDQLAERGGALEMRFTEELREIVYFDQARLLSVDHPAGMEVYANERFTAPPFPEFTLYGLSPDARPPMRATCGKGRDWTAEIMENDRRYMSPFEPGRYDGVGETHSFVIEPDEDMDLSNAVMFLTGFVNWSSSSVSLHIEQNPGMEFLMPVLQVKNRDGEWETVMNPMGLPAGKLKTIPIDLAGIFRSDDHSMRIVSSVQVHWDRIRIDPKPVRGGFEVREHRLTGAELRYGGYSRGYDLAGAGPHWYDYSIKRANAQWDFQPGAYTRYGDAAPLLSDFDDRYAIMATGDEIAAKFEPRPAAGGMERTYFLHAVGWVKDADYSTAFSQSVEPLPFRGMSAYPYGPDEAYPLTDANVDYLLEYNTRIIGRPNEPLRAPRLVAVPR